MKRITHFLLITILLVGSPELLRAQFPYFLDWAEVNTATGRMDPGGSHKLGCSNSSITFDIRARGSKGKFTIRNEKVSINANGSPAPGNINAVNRTSNGTDYFSTYWVSTTLTSQQDFLLEICYDYDVKWEEDADPQEVVYDEGTATDNSWQHYHSCVYVTILGQHTLPAMTLTPTGLCGNGPFTFCVDGGTASEGAMYDFTLPPGLKRVSGGGENPCIVVQYDPNVPFNGGQITAKRGTVCPPNPYETRSVTLPPPVTISISPVHTCDGGCAVNVYVAGGKGPFYSQLTGPNIFTSSDTRTYTITGPCTGTYSGTIVDADGCPHNWSYTMPGSGSGSGSVVSYVREGAFYRETVTGTFSGMPDCKMTLSSYYRSKLAGATIEWYQEPVSDPPPAPDATGNNVNLPEGDYAVKIVTAEGCTFWKNIHVPACQGIIMGGDEGISDVYPNPTYDNFLVAVTTTSDKPVKIKVISNTTMMPVLNNDMGVQSAGYQVYTADLAGQPAGSYTLVVTVGSNTPQTRAIVKQ